MRVAGDSRVPHLCWVLAEGRWLWVSLLWLWPPEVAYGEVGLALPSDFQVPALKHCWWRCNGSPSHWERYGVLTRGRLRASGKCLQPAAHTC